MQGYTLKSVQLTTDEELNCIIGEDDQLMQYEQKEIIYIKLEQVGQAEDEVQGFVR